MTKRKYRFGVKLFKDAKQVNQNEWLLRGQRPPLEITATAEATWNCGGEIEFVFNRVGVETCDEIWLGLYDGIGNIVEEWELCDVTLEPFNPPIEDNDETQILYEFKHMRHRAAGKQWTNWSVL